MILRVMIRISLDNIFAYINLAIFYFPFTSLTSTRIIILLFVVLSRSLDFSRELGTRWVITPPRPTRLLSIVAYCNEINY